MVPVEFGITGNKSRGWSEGDLNLVYPPGSPKATRLGNIAFFQGGGGGLR